MTASGTEQGFERLVAEHQRGVLRVCRSILRDEHLGADAAQETFLRLYARLRDEDAPRAAGAWLRRAAVSVSLDLRRRREARERALERSLADDAPRPAGPAARASSAELHERFERALTLLPEGQRTVFLMRHSAGLPLSEVAALLDLALSTVKTQFARACLRLQSALRPFAPDTREEDR